MNARRRLPVAVATTVLAVALAACGSSDGAAPAAPGTTGPAPSTTAPSTPTTGAGPGATVVPSGEPVDVATGLESPWSVAFADGVALVSERDTARIVEVGDDGSTREVATVDGVVHTAEGGLLGLAVAGDQLFAYSSGTDGNRIQRFALQGGPGSFSLGPPTTILEGIPVNGNHNGGRLAIGPDGMLYASTGDAGQKDRAQDLDALNGKILRIALDGSIPADNPFPGSPVYSYGHRNVQGMAWTADGTMYATEFGQDTWDELNRIVPGGNYGWPVVEGTAGRDGFIDPLQQWPTSEASPSGLAAVDGSLFIANLRGARLRVVPVADPSTSTELYEGRYGRLRAVTEAPDGRLWIVTSNTDGRGAPDPGDDRILSVALG